MTIDVSQFLAVFFAESFQGLADMDAGLRQIQPGEVDRETLNGVFRAAHSIKGGAATFGLPEIAEFTHPLETLLSEIRDGTRTMTGESHAVLLSSVDCLREMFEAKRNDRPIDEQAVVSQRQRLQVVLTAQHGTAVADLADRTRSVPAARVWRIEFRPERRSFTSGQDPLLVLRELARFGETRAVADFSALPGLQELDAHNCYLSWSIEQKSDVSRNAIDELFASAGNSGLQIEQITTPSDAECDTFTGEQGRSTRVSVEKIESLVNLANELVVTQSKLSRFSDDLARSVIQAMQEIGSSSGKIAEIVNVIDEVVSQTNLLALNATLEAARSGEQGRGLSVVATEVRNLARRSATAAGQIKDLIEDNVENANASAELAGNAGAALSPDADATWDAALSESQPVHYDLGRTLTLDNVEVARQHFEDLLGTEREVCLEGGELTSIDTAGLQCLCALLRGRSAGNANFSWASASLQLREAVRLTGCADLLRMPL